MRYLVLMLLIGLSPAISALELAGKTEFARSVVINSSLSTRISRIHVTPGQSVSRGDLLISLDATAQQLALEQANAKLTALVPLLEREEIEYERAQELYDRDSLAQTELQFAEQNLMIAESQLKMAETEVAIAQFQLSKSEIRAPLDARVDNITTHEFRFLDRDSLGKPLMRLIDDSVMVIRTSIPVEAGDQNWVNRKASFTYRDKTYRGRVVRLENRIQVGDNSHPALPIHLEFKTDGQVPAGLLVRVDIADE